VKEPHLVDLTVSALLNLAGPAPFVVTREGAFGIDYERIRAAVASGRVTRLRRGVLRVVMAGDARDGGADLDAIRAAALRVSPRAVVSHLSAARVHGLWVPRSGPPGCVDVIVPGAADRWDAGVRVRGSMIGDEFVTEVSGLRVTTVARTAVDVARGCRLEGALIPLDSAARLLLKRWCGTDPRRLRDVVHHPAVVGQVRRELAAAHDSVRGWPGTRILREAVWETDPASESPFESRSRGAMLLGGLPRPELGRLVQGSTGRAYYADFAWPSSGLLGEADGWGKYGDDAETMRARLVRERRRQQDLEEAGWRVLRWSPDEPLQQVVARVRTALRSAHPRG
jgi:hypothetical protein